MEAQRAVEAEGQGLKKEAIGFFSTLTIGIASVAPAYSLAAVLPFLAAVVGVQAPAIMLASFVPMLFVATAYASLNRADPDCGTTFAWATRAFGPITGWMAGWAIIAAGVIVIGLLANTAATYFFLLFGWDGAAASEPVVVAFASAIIAVATYITVRGIEISAEIQIGLLVIQVVALFLFAVFALVKVAGGDAVATSVEPEAAWLSPFAVDSTSALIAGVLLGIFVYWGWDSAVAVNEESEHSTRRPGQAAVVATLILLAIFVTVSTAAVAWLGPDELSGFEDETVINVISAQVFASPLDKLAVLAVLVSSLASTQTTVLPSSRTVLSMGRARAVPPSLARIHPRFRTPDLATIAVGGLAVAYYVLLRVVSESFYENSLAALGLLICVNYGLNAIACVVYFRREMRASLRSLLLAGVLPLLGFVMFGYVFARSIRDLTLTGVEDASYWLGLQAPLTFAIALFVVGTILMLAWRRAGGRPFFARRPETAERGILSAPEPSPAGAD